MTVKKNKFTILGKFPQTISFRKREGYLARPACRTQLSAKSSTAWAS